MIVELGRLMHRSLTACRHVLTHGQKHDSRETTESLAITLKSRTLGKDADGLRAKLRFCSNDILLEPTIKVVIALEWDPSTRSDSIVSCLSVGVRPEGHMLYSL